MAARLEGKPLKGIWYNRTLEGAARRRGEPRTFPTEETVHLTPLPAWRHLSESEYRARVAEMVAEIEEETAKRHVEEGTEPLGVERILNTDAHQQPHNIKKSPQPRFHAASKPAREALLLAYQIFVAAYRAAAEKLRDGDLTAEFPEGSFPAPIALRQRD